MPAELRKLDLATDLDLEMVKYQASPADTQKAERGEHVLAGELYQNVPCFLFHSPETRKSWMEGCKRIGSSATKMSRPKKRTLWGKHPLAREVALGHESSGKICPLGTVALQARLVHPTLALIEPSGWADLGLCEQESALRAPCEGS